MTEMLFLLIRIDTAGAKFSKSWMWVVVFLEGNNQGHME